MSQVTRRNEEMGVGPAQQAGTEIGMARASQEVQAAMLIAQNYPRNEDAAYAKIIQGCKRKRLAEEAVYAYPRGSTVVSGPSIRLAEEIARHWGNLDKGITEVERRQGESTMLAYAWDLETNTRATRTFVTQHVRETRQGNYALTDSRDIYELTANQGARRLRACILEVVPGHIVDDAVAECEKTLAGESDEPLADRIKAMVAAFVGHGVDTDMLEKRLGHKLAVTTEAEIVSLHKVFRSLRDNMASPDQFFDVSTAPRNGDKTNELNRQLKKDLDARRAAKDAADTAAKQAAESAPKPEPAPEPEPEPEPEDAPEPTAPDPDPPADDPPPTPEADPPSEQTELGPAQLAMIRSAMATSGHDAATCLRAIRQWCVDVLDIEFADLQPVHGEALKSAIVAGAVMSDTE
jgi:hypothetical protein